MRPVFAAVGRPGGREATGALVELREALAPEIAKRWADDRLPGW